MSEKVTFGELIESIAEETDRSKQSTHDFLKDFVDVINGGLKQDGTVNIAGFGKFKLRQIDEREGYNPQTEEKMTIPAHNKIVFKPYKDLRELVNAPYAHLEPELIEEDDDTEDDEEVVSTEERSGQDDFIPTAPPTSNDAIGEEHDTENEDAPFKLDKEAQADEDNSDIVEFNPEEAADNNEIDNELDEFLGTTGSSEDEASTADAETEQSHTSEEEQLASEDSTDAEKSRFAPSREAPAEKENQLPAPAIGSTEEEGKRANSLPIFIAAAFMILILAGGAWYFSLLSDDGNTQAQMATKETASISQNAEQTISDNDQQATDKQQGSQKRSQAQKAQQGQQQTANSSNQPMASSSTNKGQDRVTQTIKKGQTLWSMAEDKYGNPRLWPWIYGTNERLENPDRILAGNSLTVPLPSGPQNRLNAADSVGVAKGFIATYQWYKGQNSSKAKNHLWGAKLYHENIRNLADVKIDKADLAYANQAR